MSHPNFQTRVHPSHSNVTQRITLLTLLTLIAISLFLPGNRPLGHGHLNAPVPFKALIENWNAVAPAPSEFEKELAMSPEDLINRWNPFVAEASQRFGIPESWIRAVMRRESGGRTMAGENLPIVSDAGAIGVMQVMPETFAEMRTQYALGDDPYDPHDNIIAGTAYLRWLYGRYGFPNMFAAYNDGPGNFDKHLQRGHALPAETIAYLLSMTANLGNARHA